MANTRAVLLTLMGDTLADRAHWTYDMIRPLRTPGRPWYRGMRIVGDCSKGVQWLCWWAGAPDPMGNSFASWGNSSTICMHLQHLDGPSALEVGDIVTFGPFGDKHAAMVMEPGPDPLLWSFGHQGAPDTYRLSQDGREAQYLRLPVPAYVPTPDQRLRMMTGWFSWAAWLLGEGDWRHYGKRAARVRPNVPTVIPFGWWRRLARFLRARKQPNKETTP